MPNFELDPLGHDTWSRPYEPASPNGNSSELTLDRTDLLAQILKQDLIPIAHGINASLEAIAEVISSSRTDTCKETKDDFPSNNRQDENGWLTLRQAASHLGITQKQLRGRCNHGKIRYRRDGTRGRGGAGEYRFRQEWLEEYVNANTPPTRTKPHRKPKESTNTLTLTTKTFIPSSQWGSSVEG